MCPHSRAIYLVRVGYGRAGLLGRAARRAIVGRGARLRYAIRLRLRRSRPAIADELIHDEHIAAFCTQTHFSTLRGCLLSWPEPLLSYQNRPTT